jgi:hypothetical protein
MHNTYTQTETLIETARTPVSVTVTLTDDSDPPVYTMTSNDLPISTINSNGGNEPELKFNNYQSGTYHDGFEVTFNFVDQTNKGYGFFFNPQSPKPEDQAIWVKKVDSSGACPTSPSKWGGFNPQSVTRNTLIVDNPNSHLQYFGFTLLLSLAGETSPSVKLDPIGNNQNGSTGKDWA